MNNSGGFSNIISPGLAIRNESLRNRTNEQTGNNI